MNLNDSKAECAACHDTRFGPTLTKLDGTVVPQCKSGNGPLQCSQEKGHTGRCKTGETTWQALERHSHAE